MGLFDFSAIIESGRQKIFWHEQEQNLLQTEHFAYARFSWKTERDEKENIFSISNFERQHFAIKIEENMKLWDVFVAAAKKVSVDVYFFHWGQS